MKDTAPPLSEKARGSMFERYKDYSLDQELPGVVFHADLRLPLAARIIEAHGGKVMFESNAKSGNTCFISIPLTTESSIAKMSSG